MSSCGLHRIHLARRSSQENSPALVFRKFCEYKNGATFVQSLVPVVPLVSATVLRIAVRRTIPARRILTRRSVPARTTLASSAIRSVVRHRMRSNVAAGLSAILGPRCGVVRPSVIGAIHG
jgi:hypothetical protein